jgi:hypothetical protein
MKKTALISILLFIPLGTVKADLFDFNHSAQYDGPSAISSYMSGMYGYNVTVIRAWVDNPANNPTEPSAQWNGNTTAALRNTNSTFGGPDFEILLSTPINLSSNTEFTFNLDNLPGAALLTISDGGRRDVGIDNLEINPAPVPGTVLLGIIGMFIAGLKLRKIC